MALIVGVTGSIAAGKSLLCQRLVERHGALHVDADREIHQLYAPGTPGFDRVVAEFGSDIVGADGVIDRRVLGSKVFGKPERMEALRTAIGDIAGHFMGILRGWRADLPDDAIAVFEAINLLQNEYMTVADTAWLVVCEPATAIARLMEHRGLAREEAEQRLASARDWHEQAPLVDRIFHNDSTIEALHAEVDAALEETATAHREGTLPPHCWREQQAAGRD